MPTKHLTGLDILVVEDESLLRKQIAAQLESLGADVAGVDALQAARQSLANFSFDFALLDVNLPDGRGTTLLEEKVFPPNTGVIVMTAARMLGVTRDYLRYRLSGEKQDESSPERL